MADERDTVTRFDVGNVFRAAEDTLRRYLATDDEPNASTRIAPALDGLSVAERVTVCAIFMRLAGYVRDLNDEAITGRRHDKPYVVGDRVVIDTRSTKLPVSDHMKRFHGRHGVIRRAYQLPAPQSVTLDDGSILLVNVAYLRSEQS